MSPSTCRATTGERHLPLPGDGLVPRPGRVVTHGISIRARADQVWPWLVQMGGGRAGHYIMGSKMLNGIRRRAEARHKLKS